MTERVHAYVDGFNLYFGGLKSNPHLRWLDLQQLAEQFLQPQQVLTSIDYFTAPVKGDQNGFVRQDHYQRALREHSPTVTIHSARHQEKHLKCPDCGHEYVRWEEKETDVDLGVHLVADAAIPLYDTAFLVSCDTDFVPAVRAAKRLHPTGTILGVLPPNMNFPKRLVDVLDGYVHITEVHLAKAQLPPVVTRAKGNAFKRPVEWS